MNGQVGRARVRQKRWQRWVTSAQQMVTGAQDVLSPQRRDDFGTGVGRPVLLLHGFGAPRRILAVLERRLRRNLGVSVMSFHLEGFGGVVGAEPMADEANRLADKLERLCIRHGVESLDVVGHSRGGLLARHMVTHHPVGRRVHTLIALGSPFSGSPLAVLGTATLGLWSRAVRDLMPFSPFTRALKAAPVPRHVNLLSVAGGLDVVAPPALCRVPPQLGAPGRVRNHVVPGVGHNGLLMSQRVFALVRDELRRSREEAP